MIHYYEKQTQNPPIKIEKVDYNHKSAKVFKKKTIKETFGKDKINEFENVIVYITHDENTKLKEFANYCNLFNCINLHCKRNMNIEYFKSNENHDQLIYTCPKCNYIGKDSFNESKNYAIWFNSLISKYGLDFKNGVPRLIICKVNRDIIIEWHC